MAQGDGTVVVAHGEAPRLRHGVGLEVRRFDRARWAVLHVEHRRLVCAPRRPTRRRHRRGVRRQARDEALRGVAHGPLEEALLQLVRRAPCRRHQVVHAIGRGHLQRWRRGQGAEWGRRAGQVRVPVDPATRRMAVAMVPGALGRHRVGADHGALQGCAEVTETFVGTLRRLALVLAVVMGVHVGAASGAAAMAVAVVRAAARDGAGAL
mmetsp:Transcript_49798/g.144803  ORF Transcript_49798/g.144803 Transcript_49798/m.144803 type:complete len:209 (+) Transcript_49798:255-881(+)